MNGKHVDYKQLKDVEKIASELDWRSAVHRWCRGVYVGLWANRIIISLNSDLTRVHATIYLEFGQDASQLHESNLWYEMEHVIVDWSILSIRKGLSIGRLVFESKLCCIGVSYKSR